jgi:predicted RNA-binding Zn-ribbon protein involved in translation (DUF1610 family)
MLLIWQKSIAAKGENTICPKCGNLCIKRIGYSVNIHGLTDGKCAKCGYILLIIINKNKK